MPPNNKKARRTPPKPKKVPLTQAQYESGQLKCLELIEAAGLTIPTEPYDPFESDYKNLSDATKKSYRDIWNELLRFFYTIGCYQSAMLVDRSICPTRPLPFRPESLALYFTYRCATKGVRMVHPITKLPVRDLHTNRQLRTVGGWSAPSMLYKAHAAILFLHEKMYPLSCSGPYQAICSACVQVNEQALLLQSQNPQEPEECRLSTYFERGSGISDAATEQKRISACQYIMTTYGFYRSCQEHANNPPLKSKGNVLTHALCKNTYDAWLKLKLNTHQTKGCGQLYPREVRKLRDYLLGAGDVASIQMWVMILLCVRLFLRSDEVLTLRVDNFVHAYYPKQRNIENSPPETGLRALTQCQVVNNEAVESITMEIQGKCDKQPTWLCLF